MNSFRWQKLAPLEDIPAEKGLLVVVENKAIALFRQNEKIYAIENTCPHRGAPLAEGTRIEEKVRCPWHGFQFSLTTGQCLSPSNNLKVKTFPTKVEKGMVFVQI